MVSRDFPMPAERSFLGAQRPSWTDLLRLRTLKDWQRAILRHVRALEALPPSSDVSDALEREKAYLEVVRHETTELETLLALL